LAFAVDDGAGQLVGDGLDLDAKLKQLDGLFRNPADPNALGNQLADGGRKVASLDPTGYPALNVHLVEVPHRHLFSAAVDVRRRKITAGKMTGHENLLG